MGSNDIPTIEPVRRWPAGCLLLTVVLPLLLGASCALGAAGIGSGVIAPPAIQHQLGPVELVARTVRVPTCRIDPCPEYVWLNPAAAQRRYGVWVIVHWPYAQGRRFTIYHVAQIALEQP